MQVCISLQTDNHANTPTTRFLQAGCPSCRPTNSVKALKAIPPTATYTYLPLPPNGMYLTSKLTCLIMSTVNTHTFNGPLSSTTRVSRYQNTKTNLDFTAARDSEWQWHQLGHMEVCTSLQIDKDASTTQLSLLQALPAVQPTASKH